MLDLKDPLIAEFLKDHQQFSRLLFEISKLLEEDKIEEARNRANELDSIAGPHIAYEEAELYSRLSQLGEKSVSKEALVKEHHDVLDSLKTLLSNSHPDETELQGIKSGFRDALTHAEHCGSLISLMSRLDEQQRSESLKTLYRLRAQRRKWTELG